VASGEPKVNNEIYETYGERWYTAWDDPVALLRAESRAKLPWVASRIPLPGAALLDIGCGAGFLSNPLSELGFRVTGLDLSADSLLVAARHDRSGQVRYLQGDAHHLPFPDSSFQAVLAMDFLEHVESPGEVIREVARVLKPGGRFFFHTFNRNPLAGLVVIKLVEWLVANTPENLHLYRLFLKPSELKELCAASGLKVEELTGLAPKLSSLSWRGLRTGVVPESLEFRLVRSTWISYLGYAQKAL
jgi:2-polyprenyl-6-hydroxyphenyl methylase / 3-demethylubiquinone-9 3-methyltransferase